MDHQRVSRNDRATLVPQRGDMLSAELPFRQNYIQYKQLFPQYIDTMLVVIDGDTPESAQRAAQTLAERVRADHALVKTVYRPGNDPFFDTNAVLYLRLSELEDLTDSLVSDSTLSGQAHRGPRTR